MLSRFQRGALFAPRRTISCKPKPERKSKKIKYQPCPDKRKTYNQCCFNDPKYFWLESTVYGRRKTWQEVEEEFACMQIYRCSKKAQPSRILFYHQDGDFEICRRGCLHPCTPPPCEDFGYQSPKQYLLSGITHLVTASMFFGLLYLTYRWHIWESSSGTLVAIMGDPDEKIDFIGHALMKSLADKWNRSIAALFVGVKKLLSHMDEEGDDFNECEFMIKVQDGVKEGHEAMKQNYHTVKCGIAIESDHVFQEWELVYNYKEKTVKADESCDLSWKWMDHPEPGYIGNSVPVMPYESAAKELQKAKKKNAKLASIYTDLCSEWKVDPAHATEENECDNASSRSSACKRRHDRKNKTRINPADCKCPLQTASTLNANQDDK